MLVLSRRANESIVFPDLGITVEVVRVKGSTVRLGIKAPESIRILRGELEAVANEFGASRDREIPPTAFLSIQSAPVVPLQGHV